MKSPNLMESVDPCSGRYSFRADVRLNAWLMVAVALHLVALYYNKPGAGRDAAVGAVLALLPLIPALLYVRSWMRFIRGLDELQRRIQVEAFLFAAMATVLLGATVTVLNEHGIATGPLEHGLGLGASFMTMLCFWGIGWGIAKCRYP